MEIGTISEAEVPLHSVKPMRRGVFNRAFATVYAAALLALFYRHASSLLFLQSTSLVSICITISLLVSDFILGFMWLTTQSFRMYPVTRHEYPENLEKLVLARGGFPAMDIFICTADPYKEPPVSVINTALSVMAYDYPTDKISVYVSDDGGSQLTLFAFMEAAKFGKHWLPFCRLNNIMERCPDAYFRSNYSTSSPETAKLKTMYESLKLKVEDVVERGKIPDEYISSEEDREAFSMWAAEGFTRQNHPTVIKVLLETNKDKDITGHSMPNLIYLSREKSITSPHHFKAGALNALLRVSAIMTNAPIILTLDCDMYSNDPRTPRRVLCYFSDNSLRPQLGYIQFPQRFHGLNEADIYSCEFKRLFQINPAGMDSISGPNYVGTGCFFSRRVFFGGPSSLLQPEIPELSPYHAVKNSNIGDTNILELANNVAGCMYEDQTSWGYKIGLRYGSLVEDYYTGYRLLCEGWKSIFCNPERPVFLGDIPISLNDVLSQTKRWSIGLLEVALSKYCPLTFGTQAVGILMGLNFAHYAFWPLWSIPITVYAFIPQLTLLNGISIFPKLSDPWFYLYLFLFCGAYGQDCLDFILAQGTFKRWWSDQRMWLLRAPSSYLFGTVEYITKHLGIATHGFNVTSKVVDDEQSKRYDQGVFEFGVPSPTFLPLATAAIINLIAFLGGLLEIFRKGNFDGMFVQMFLAGFAVLNCLPIYEAMVFRSDKGRMPTKTTTISTFLAWIIYTTAPRILKI